jgi:hypothetical protein
MASQGRDGALRLAAAPSASLPPSGTFGADAPAKPPGLRPRPWKGTRMLRDGPDQGGAIIRMSLGRAVPHKERGTSQLETVR